MTEQLIIILEKWGALDWSGLLVLAPVFFICAALLPVPRTALCLGSRAIFGLSAIPIIVPSSTLGAVVAFLLTRYLFWPFTAATFICTIPQICLYVYLGALGKEMLVEHALGPLRLGLGCIAALTMCLIVFLIGRRARALFRDLAPQATHDRSF